MTKNIFVRKKSDARETGQSGQAQFFIATVASVTAAEGVTIIPDGQTEAVAKKYKVLTAGTAPPAVGDRVVVMRHSGTCVILGAIGEPEDMDADARITDVETEITEIDTELGKKVNKAGDTMTGSLTLSAGNAGIYENTTAYEVGVPPSSDFYTIGLRNRDKNGTVFTAFNSALLRNGNIAARMIATKGSISNYLQLVIDSNNNQSISVSNAQAWRKALGLGNASGAFPITVAQGGTGNTGIVVVDTIANIISAASGFTITQAAFCAWGKIAMIYVRAKATEATSSGWHTVGTVVSGKRPAVMLHASELNFGASSFYITGEIQVYGAMTADKNLYLSATYLLA